MKIKQFEDRNLSQFSYAILSDCEKKIVLIDPARNPEPYLRFAKENDATIIGIIETHPHADFVSSHFELHKITGAPIYVSKLVDAMYPHQTFDEGQQIEFGKIKLIALDTPGHSPDSISILLEHDEKQKAVFTGDTLFVGDCGRPDLREGAGKIHAAARELAKQMYHTLRNKFMSLNDDVIVYPAHGAGTLCGRNLSEQPKSTIGDEKKTNWSLQQLSEEDFVDELLNEQPFVPAYFPFNVELNRNGATSFKESVDAVKISQPISSKENAARLRKNLWIVDTRKAGEYKTGHLPHSINLMDGDKFETWLGTIIKPNESFYLAGENEKSLRSLIERTASIGYEIQIEEAFILNQGFVREKQIDVDDFKHNPSNYTIIDVRNESEVKNKKMFPGSLSIPLADLRKRLDEVPNNKPIVVHCAGGYRSAAASSLLSSKLNGEIKVLDLGEAVKGF